ncbi:hypothetical protein IWW34DRAFT_812172 [Fusarium oxysporum f. sp. albedinis]|nr:hypothetical protein IWW34DRAFT_812369 [Fusarium oxysporum f. sp. albedinis]KAI3570837.1 hypothetical protein IWW34DRAFT_812172 [Fusarium oxysporum f. sp. albedinis]
MEFLLSCFYLVSFCVWILCSRVPKLRLALVDKINIRRAKEKKADSLCQMIEYNVKKSYTALLEADDSDQSGFAPPRITRALISILIAIQNLIALGHASRADEPIRGVVLCSGKLALTNLLPLFLFGSHEIILVKVLRHSRQQVLWAHSLFAWIVLLETVIHVGLSLFLTSGLSWIMGFMASRTSVALCVSLYLAIRMQTRVRRTFHGIVGIISILGGMIHLLQSTASLLLGLGIIGLGATGIHGLWRPGSIENATPKGNARRYVELKVRVPDSKHDFYIKSRGTFYRVAWVTGQDSSQYEATVLLPPSAIEDRPVSRTTREEVRVTCDGLLRAPLSPYTYLAKDLDIIATESGIFEGYSCFKWRQRLLEPKNSPYFKINILRRIHREENSTEKAKNSVTILLERL